jgi:hypothetical protein
VSALASLGWLEGSWLHEEEGRRVEEVWLAPAGGMLLGLNRDVGDAKRAFFEYLRIEERDDGIFYVSSPRGAPPTDFRLVTLERDRVVFENPVHDFPQRIEYRRAGDELRARISNLDESSGRTSEWHWRLVR